MIKLSRQEAPNFEYYHVACQLKNLVKWLNTNTNGATSLHYHIWNNLDCPINEEVVNHSTPKTEIW